MGQLTFYEPDTARFPCLALARQALEQGGAAPVVLNAANEVAVAAFLEQRIRFTHIPELIERTVSELPAASPGSIHDIVGIDAEARRRAQRIVGALAGGSRES